MTISELIKELEIVLEEDGDLPVYCHHTSTGLTDEVSCVDVRQYPDWYKTDKKIAEILFN